MKEEKRELSDLAINKVGLNCTCELCENRLDHYVLAVYERSLLFCTAITYLYLKKKYVK
jgi:hypothetical protein